MTRHLDPDPRYHDRYCPCSKCAPLPEDVERASLKAEDAMLANAAGERPTTSDPVAVRYAERRAALVASGHCPHGSATSPHPVTRYLPGGGRQSGECSLAVAP